MIAGIGGIVVIPVFGIIRGFSIFVIGCGARPCAEQRSRIIRRLERRHQRVRRRRGIRAIAGHTAAPRDGIAAGHIVVIMGVRQIIKIRHGPASPIPH